MQCVARRLGGVYFSTLMIVSQVIVVCFFLGGLCVYDSKIRYNLHIILVANAT